MSHDAVEQEILLMAYYSKQQPRYIKCYTIKLIEVVKERVLEEEKRNQHSHNGQLWKVSAILSNYFCNFK